MKKIALLFIFILISACHPYRGFLESEFELAADSPLPTWFPEIPEGYTRDDLKIKMRYYSPFLDVDNVVFYVEASWWNTLYKETGRGEHVPEFWEWAQVDWPKWHYPSYYQVTINGQTEIIEHRKMEPIFYISNKEAVEKAMSRRVP